MHNKYTEMLAEKQGKARDQLILLALPEHAILSRVTAIQHGPGWQEIDREFQQALAAYEAWKNEIEKEPGK